jgi:8-oxo-dGTP pyrophosphatase MutT (NUDIX family)
MTFTRISLIQALQDYRSSFADEMTFREPFLKLLEHPRCFHRDFLPGHITASAWITDAEGQHVLLTHHAKLNRWLQPGGHADGEEDVLNVALREATEETGLKNFTIRNKNIFDIDIHLIPARGIHFEHYHYDIRFIFQADLHAPLHISEESNDLKWIALHELEKFTTAASLIRMKEKGKLQFT